MAPSSPEFAKSSAVPDGAARFADRRTEGRYPISVVAEMTGVAAHTLRGYERAGLLMPERTGGGMRLYSPRDVAVVRRITALAAERVNLAGIRRILALEAEVASLRAELDGSQELIAAVPAQRAAPDTA